MPDRSPAAPPPPWASLLFAVAIGVGLACSASTQPYSCTSASQCARGAEQGFCEASGTCSFPDPACPSGRRYAELSGPSNNGCVTQRTDGANPEFSDGGHLHGDGPSRVFGDGPSGVFGDGPSRRDGAGRDRGARDGSRVTDQRRSTDGPRDAAPERPPADLSLAPDLCECVPGVRQDGTPVTCSECVSRTPSRVCGLDCRWGPWTAGTCVGLCGPAPDCGDSCHAPVCHAGTGCAWRCQKSGCTPGTWKCCTTSSGQPGSKTCKSDCSYGLCGVAPC
ncbi:MAG: hypothetical protein IT371_07490 [Deltaproteobacteria bacterium]|nr:hypothetical protein [Deltaproteobacteria bacterium]